MLKSGLVSLGSVGLGLGSRLGLGSPLGALRLCTARAFAAKSRGPVQPVYPKRPPCAWSLFVGEKLKGSKGWGQATSRDKRFTLYKLSGEFKSLPQCEKDVYKREAERRREKYNIQMAALPPDVREAHPTRVKLRATIERRRRQMEDLEKMGVPKADAAKVLAKMAAGLQEGVEYDRQERWQMYENWKHDRPL